VIARKPPAKRAFPGLVGRPFEPAPVETVSAPTPPPKTKSAVRAESWRNKKREQGDEAFREQDRKRKELERGEKKRQGQVEDVLQSSDPPLTVVNESGKTVRVTTGGYSLRRIERVAAASEASASGRRVKPHGAGSQKFEDSQSDRDFPDQGHEDTFVEKAFRQCRKPQDVRAMRAFIFQNVRDQSLRSKVKVCAACSQPLTAHEQDLIQTAFLHFHDKHAELFKVLLARLGQKTVCAEDHRGLVERHSGGNYPVQCRKCKRILWKPQRSDKSGGKNEQGDGNRVETITS
jgi:hypothetical protein